MSAVKMKLNSQGMQILIGELQQNEMCAIYLMGLGKEMTDCITKLDLTRIISILCKKLNWIEVEEDSLENWFNKEPFICLIENFALQGPLCEIRFPLSAYHIFD